MKSRPRKVSLFAQQAPSAARKPDNNFAEESLAEIESQTEKLKRGVSEPQAARIRNEILASVANLRDYLERDRERKRKGARAENNKKALIEAESKKHWRRAALRALMVGPIVFEP